MPTLPAPTTEPTIMRINDNGLYSITLPNVTGSEADGSGQTGSDVMTGNGQDREVYLVRVSRFDNETFFPAVSCTHENIHNVCVMITVSR